ncbi:MAG: twin-arginine translocase TatA/TatE family subunit [Flavobacteriales bacterium]|nr:twin-arginine translocase TatA/TatE family subunit [Flavobacteriales bacterium]
MLTVNQILLFGMPGGGEIIFILFIIVMLFGSKKIPELARGLGKGMREIKNATNDIQKEIREGAREINNAKDFTNVEKQVNNLIAEDKSQKEEVKVDATDEVQPETDQSPQTPEIKPVEHPNAIRRGNPAVTPPTNGSEQA